MLDGHRIQDSITAEKDLHLQFLLEKARTPIEMEERFTAIESQLMKVRSFAKNTLGSI
jgi:hypothetical protein